MSTAYAAADSMDRIYRYQRFIYDVTRRHYLLGRDTLIEGLIPPDHGSVLEIGCGTARNLIRTARRYPDAQLYGIDISAAMLETAARRVAAAGLQDRIRLAQADAVSFDAGRLFGQPHMDRVFISYALSMIPAWQLALDRAAIALKPRGSLHIVDFGDCDELPALARTALRAWLAWFSVTPRDELASTLAATATRHGLHRFHAALYRGYTAYAVLTRW